MVRLLAWLITKPGTVDIVAPSDFVAFGLVLHISNINEVEHTEYGDQDWKFVQRGLSLAFIAIYGFLLAVALIGGSVVERNHLVWCAIALSVVSLVMSFAVHKRLPVRQVNYRRA